MIKEKVEIHTFYLHYGGELPVVEDDMKRKHISRKTKKICDSPPRLLVPLFEIARQIPDHEYDVGFANAFWNGVNISSYDTRKYDNSVEMLRGTNKVVDDKCKEIEADVLRYCSRLIVAGCSTVYICYRQSMTILGGGKTREEYKPQVAYIAVGFYGEINEKAT